MNDLHEGRITAVIVTYNRKELLKECVQALLKQSVKECDVLIIDNASTDGTPEYIADELKNSRVHYDNTGSNLGGAGGFCYGIRKACEMGYDYLWLMDDDCIVKENSLKELLKLGNSLQGNYGFLSSRVLWKDGKPCRMNQQKISLVKKLKEPEKDCQKIVLATFVSLFVPASVVKNVGLPYKEFVIWTDDWEYTRRISLKYPCYYSAKSIVVHKSKNNDGPAIETADEGLLERFGYMYRNETVLYRREGIKGRILFWIRREMHKKRIRKSSLPDDEKKRRIQLMDEAVEKGKKFYPQVEYPGK